LAGLRKFRTLSASALPGGQQNHIPRSLRCAIASLGGRDESATPRGYGSTSELPAIIGEWLATALGSPLALILGVSRTTLTMARDHHLPHALAAAHPRFKVPQRAGLAVGAGVAILAATTDARGAIGFSSFGVLAYYAIANA